MDSARANLKRTATDHETRLVLIGRTGEGKTSTANSLLGGNVWKVKTSAKSVTSDCSYTEKDVGGKHIVLVDTPGLFDTDKENDTTLIEISKCLIVSSPGPHAFFLVLTTQRFTKEIEETVRLLRKVFGEKVLESTIVLFTRKDDLDFNGTTIEEFLEDIPDYMKNVLKACGNRYMAINNRLRGKENDEQIATLLGKVDDLVKSNGGTYYSSMHYEEVEAKIKEEETRRLEAIEKKRRDRLEVINRENKIKAEREAAIAKANAAAEEEARNIRRKIREETVGAKILDALVTVGETAVAVAKVVKSVWGKVTGWFK